MLPCGQISKCNSFNFYVEIADHCFIFNSIVSFLILVGSFQEVKHSSQSGMIPGSWQYKMKLQLILKSSKAYYVLSDAAVSLQKYGRALRYIRLALQCYGKQDYFYYIFQMYIFISNLALIIYLYLSILSWLLQIQSILQFNFFLISLEMVSHKPSTYQQEDW